MANILHKSNIDKLIRRLASKGFTNNTRLHQIRRIGKKCQPDLYLDRVGMIFNRFFRFDFKFSFLWRESVTVFFIISFWKLICFH
jgi:hypothetical protein